MKIKINDKETYCIDLEFDELSAQEFCELLERLNNIRRLLGKDLFAQMNQIQRTSRPRSYNITGTSRKFNEDRNEAIRVLRIHYHGSRQDKEKLAKEYNRLWDVIIKGLPYCKAKWKILPAEVGLKAFPTKGTGSTSVNNLRIENFDISKEVASLSKVLNEEDVKRSYRKRKTARKRKFSSIRDEALRILRIHYHGKKEHKEAIAKEYSTEWIELSKGFSNVRKRWNIAPDEVGLIEFPSAGNINNKNYLITNYDISKEIASLSIPKSNETKIQEKTKEKI